MLDAIHFLGILYADQGKLGEVEQMYKRALHGYEEALGREQVQQYMPALHTLKNTGDLYVEQAETDRARTMYAQALSGLSCVLGQSSDRCKELASKIDALPILGTGREQHPSLQAVGERSKTQHNGNKESSRLSLRNFVRKVF
jgi:tetratricopeptide (TPR) repeat protein